MALRLNCRRLLLADLCGNRQNGLTIRLVSVKNLNSLTQPVDRVDIPVRLCLLEALDRPLRLAV